MNPLFAGILLGTLLGAALGNRMRCYDCGGGPSGLCKETVTTCGEDERCGFLERKPQPDLAQTKLPGNPSVTLIHHHPACVAAHHCNRVETEVVGDVTYTTHRDCCVGDLCNGAVASTAAPMSIVAAAVTMLAWLLPGLWRGFPACKGLSKGRRPILWASPSGTPTVPPAQPFAGRINALDLGIRRLELLLSAGDSGTFICKGRQEEESRTELHVLGDRAYCKALVPLVKAEPQRPEEEEEPKMPGDLDQEPSLLYADLDHMALRSSSRLSPVVPADASTIYAVVV
ncbi:hypothetical protein E5288_WYG005225 [Bos mutus]|uniref:Lymphocyte antigen 6 complex locus protein G6d n=3 Tax=Bovinae TaxID=27592 RepID=A0A6B0S5R3_9CETA|nr:hypothetical protein [Bos mutus]